MSKQPEPLRPLAPASGSATCCWILSDTGQHRMSPKLCGEPATHIEPIGRYTYCGEHAEKIADVFGYDQIDQIAPNDQSERLT